MPVFRRPDVKGNLYVQFTIQFPDSGFLEESQLKVCSGYNHVICVCSVGSLSIHRPPLYTCNIFMLYHLVFYN